ncbi:hypothetical protein D9M73_186700 [compost metagenome]
MYFAETAFFHCRVEHQRRALRQFLYGLDAVDQLDAPAGRVVQHHALTTAGMLQRLDARCAWQALGGLQVIQGFHGEGDGAEDRGVGALGDVDVGQRAGAAEIQALFGAVLCVAGAVATVYLLRVTGLL